MKYFLILLILSASFCLKAKKSPFDVSKPSLGMWGFIYASLNRPGGDTTPPTVTVTNLKSKGTIETGLLVGTASDNVGVTSVEVQINSGSYAAATVTGATATTKNWTYKIPITAKWTYAFTNTVNIRVKDPSGNTTVSALTSVQKGEFRDINGDGFADLVVGAPTYNTNQGRVYAFDGSVMGISQTSAGSANQTFTGTVNRNFGSSIAMTDINGDGFSDLVVCEFLNSAATNSAYYYLGSSSGFGSKSTINQIASTEYCSSVAVGDFNNDGYGDVAIADTVASGTIGIYLGTASGLNLTVNQTITRSGPTNFGGSITIGDIDGDGKLDLVSRTLSAPNVYSFLGNANTFIQSSSITLTSTISSLVLGDFNGDGKADLAIGETGLNAGLGANQGRIHIFLSNGTTLNTTASQTIDGEAAGNNLSVNLSVGDVNLDGITDLIAGNADYNSDQGRVYVFYGCLNTGICKGSGNAGTVSDIKITGVTGSSLFGFKTRLTDLNGDGYPDLLVGASGLNVTQAAQGGLYLFNGTSSGILSSITSTSNANLTILGQTSPSGNFGSSLY